jgi:hypothetical protein
LAVFAFLLLAAACGPDPASTANPTPVMTDAMFQDLTGT